MADNAAQAIKDLQKNIESLDVSLDKALKSQEKYTQMIAKTFQDAANQGKTSIDELVAYIGKKTKQVNAEKIKLQIDLGLGKKGELEQQIASMKNDIAKYEKSKDTHTAELLKQQLKDLEDEYKRLASASKKSAAQMYDDMLKIVNAAAGTKKDGKGTALGQARAAAAKENLNTIKEIDRLTTQIAEKQEKLGKYKEGSKNWEKTKKDIEEAGKKLQQYQDKLNRLQGRKVEDASAKAIKDQVINMRELYNLNKQYQQMLGKKRQGLLVNPQDLDDTKRRLREIVDEMKKIEAAHPGSRKTAAARLETERLRDRWKDANRETKANRLELDKMLPTLQRLASAFGVAFSIRGLAQFGKKLIEVRGEFELQQVALRSILQNKQLADEIWDKTMRAALQSPFTAMQLTQYTKQLAAYRIETAKLFDTTKRLADVSAGLGVDMQRLILAYGQVKAANYLRASEIRQFTEAGVNILGELSQYFTEAKGEMVSTAQVMEMVQKRMVRFEDVAEIFKRMTDQGGIFYNMQYIQSQTVRGQMMKLKDAFDQMLNSIGQGNEGVIKNLISLLNDIVKNWREWKTAIDLIAWPVIISMLYKFALGLIAVDAAAIKASVGMNTMVVAGARLQLLFKRLWAAIAAHPLLALASALAAVGVALWNHAKAVNGINKAYEDLMLRTYETQKNLGEYSKTIQRNSEIMAHATKDTDEYNKAYSENEKIISKLSNDYPDLLKDIDLQKEGYGVLIDKIEAYNKKLEDRIRLEYAARASFGTDDLATNIADLQEAQRKREMEFLENRENAEKRYLELKEKGAKEDPWWKEMRLAKNWAEQVDVLERNKTAMRDGGISLLSQGFVMPGIGGFWGGGVQSRAADLSANIKKESLIYNDIIKEQLKSINENLGDDIETFIKANQDEVDRMFKDKEGVGWKLLNERITEFFTAKGVAGRESQQVIQDLLNQFLLIPIQLDWSENEAGSTYQPDFELNAANLRKQVNLLEEMKKRYDELSKSAYGYAKSEEKVRQAFKDSFEEIFNGTGIDMKDIDFTSMGGLSASIQKVLDASTNIKEEVKQEIMKKIDSYEARIEIDAQVRVRENFAREIEKMFSDYELTLNFESIGLPSDLAKKLFGVDTSSLDEISSYMKNFVSEHTSDWNDEINKVYTDSLKKLGDKEQEMFKKSISSLFKRVKNSADEMKTVMAQAAADINFADMLFDKQEAKKNIDTITEQIEKNIEEINRLTPTDGKATGVAAQQIARLEAENKILQNRVLRLSQMYGNLSAEQYTDLVRATMEHENEQLQKISLEQLKQLPEYIEAMGRTAGWSNEKLREMLDYLQNLISVSGGNIDITEYKSIINQIDKIQAEIKHNDYPFGREGFAKVAQMLQEQSEAEAKLNELTEERNQLVSEQKLLELEEIELQARLNELKAKGLDENSTEIQEIMDDIKSNQKFKISNLNAQKKNAAGIQTITKGNAQTMAIIDAIIHGINNLVQEIYQNLKKVELLLQDYEVDTEHGMWAKWAKGMETFAKASQDATNGWEAYKKGDIAGIVYEVINGITDIWHGINEMVSQKHVDTIYEMEQELERLTVDYEKLQKAIEKTWDTSSYMMNYEKMVKNLEDQRKVLQAQYDAEDARKNSDEEKMKEYQNSIRDIDETLAELKQKQIEVFGGLGDVNYRSAAQEFVDAWKEAFLETGDGLQGLQDHFDEFLNEWFVKQATMRIAGKMLQPLFEDIDKAVDESSQGGTNVLLSELQRVRERFSTIAPQLSDALEQLAGMWGLGEDEGGLSGLAAGIQGMTEEQANILEAYWNSVRMYTASIDMNVSRIADMLGAGSRDITNPQLQQLELIAHNTASIQRMFESVVMSGHTKGQSGIRVFVD